MFAGRYFAPRYFAPKYFPPVIEIEVVTIERDNTGGININLTRTKISNDDKDFIEIIQVLLASGLLDR